MFLLMFGASIMTAVAQRYQSQNLRVSIFSSTPIEDIKASSKTGMGILIIEKQEIVTQVNIRSLEFDKKLMQEHFNENYMESDKFPTAKFKGIISPTIDWKKDGVYPVSVKGTLTVHGVEQQRTIPGTIEINNNQIAIKSTFKVSCASHQIKIPSLMFTKIAEVIEVKVEGNFTVLNK